MTRFSYSSDVIDAPVLGLIVLQSDETIEGDFRAMLPQDQPLLVSRVPSDVTVTPDTLQAMAGHLTGAASLFPRAAQFAAMGYGCTSGTAQIGAARIAELVREGTQAAHVTNPLSALLAACETLGLSRLAFLSPYVAEVSDKLRAALATGGVETPVFGSFEEAEEAKVVRIDAGSIEKAAEALAEQGGVDGIFLSCTNLRTLGVIDRIEARTGLPCLSSNQVTCWHMARLAGVAASVPGRLGQAG